MFLKISAVAIASIVLISCGAGDQKEASKDSTTMAMPHMHDSTTAKKQDFSAVKFDLPKDLVCNMPVTAGIEDTAHFDGKVLGFCSKECKDEFLKDPAGYLAKK